MEIVQVNDTFVPGRGIDRVIYEVAKRMDAEISILASSIEYDIPGAEKIELNVRKNLHPALWMIPRVKQYVRENNHKVFHFHHMVLNWALSAPKTLCTFHGWSPHHLDRSHLFRRKMRQKFLELTARRYRLAPRVTAVNSYQLPFLKKMGVSDPIHIPNGVDTNKFFPTEEDEGYMLFVGRLADQKRPEELIRLSAEVDYPLHIVGDGPLRETIERLKEKLDAPVSILGKISEKKLIEEYQQSSFFVSASRWEGMTLTVPEAYSCGKPVVVYNIPSMSEFPIGAHCANYEEMVSEVKSLISDKKRRADIGAMGRAYALENLDWQIITDKYMELFQLWR